MAERACAMVGGTLGCFASLKPGDCKAIYQLAL